MINHRTRPPVCLGHLQGPVHVGLGINLSHLPTKDHRPQAKYCSHLSANSEHSAPMRCMWESSSYASTPNLRPMFVNIG